MNAQGDRGPNALLDDYADLARRVGRLALERTALRTRSLAYRDLLAHAATGGALDLSELLTSVLGGAPLPRTMDPLWVASLARVLALQDMLADDRQHAIDLLLWCAPDLPAKRQTPFAKLLVELLYDSARFEDAASALDQHPALTEIENGYLRTDLLNPFSGSPYGDRQAWHRAFSGLFEEHGLSAPLVEGSAESPFDRLRASGQDEPVDGPLVSVVMTTYEPDPQALMVSARSILDQSWRNLELIVVDDHSTTSAAIDGLKELEAVDPRVRLIRLERNGGTYIARNHGIRASRGAYVTGQDDDDWSHPDRVRRQIEPMLADATLPGTLSSHFPARENLVIQRVGYNIRTPNASSAMYRKEHVLELGGFIATRKASDTELLKRVERHAGRAVPTLPEPLAVVRLRAASLSRSDFRAGWRHPARRAYRSAYQRWHADSDPSGLVLPPTGTPVPIPRAFMVHPPETSPLDVVLAGDWRSFGGPQKSMIEEIRALVRAGYRVGVLALEAARFMTPRMQDLCGPIQRLINAGIVTQVLEDDPTPVRLLVLRYPPILQFPPSESLRLKAERFIIVANQAPSERDGSDIRYDPATCADNAEELVGTRALWVPQGPTVRATLHGLASAELAPFDMPGILDADEWSTDRSYFRSKRPVVGRHSRDNRMKWPSTRADLLAAYPDDGTMDVRIMGGTRSALEVLGEDQPPPSWLALPRDAMPVRTFLNSLDYFVYFQHPTAYDAFGRSVLEALAAGCVAILPRHMEATFGDAALYCDVSEARHVVSTLYGEPEQFQRQAEVAMQRVREHFSHERYVQLVERILAGPASLSPGATPPAG